MSILQGERNTSGKNHGLPAPTYRAVTPQGQQGPFGGHVPGSEVAPAQTAQQRAATTASRSDATNSFGNTPEAIRARYNAVGAFNGGSTGAANPLEALFQVTPPAGSPSGGGGRSYGGGGGGGKSPAEIAAEEARKAAIIDYFNQSQGNYFGYDEELKKMYNNDGVNATYDAGMKGINEATAGGTGRLTNIYNDLMARNQQASQAMDQAYATGDQNLQALQGRYMANNAQMDSGLNNSLSAFGAGSLQDGSGDQLSQLFANGQSFNNNLRSTFAAGNADRNNVYAGINSDAMNTMTASGTALQRAMEARKVQDIRANDMARIQAQQTNSRSRIEDANTARMAAAELGITIPDWNFA